MGIVRHTGGQREWAYGHQSSIGRLDKALDEAAQIGWTVVDNDHIYLLIPMQACVGQFLQTFQEYPPRQKAASFTVDQVMEKLTDGLGSSRI